eukprot:625842-Pleurochrysis_carterae.AAC.1
MFSRAKTRNASRCPAAYWSKAAVCRCRSEQVASHYTQKNVSCNTTCYKRDTCNTKLHRVAIFGVPAKAMTDIRSKFKVAEMSPGHQRL